jgi:hypothetical protein
MVGHRCFAILALSLVVEFVDCGVVSSTLPDFPTRVVASLVGTAGKSAGDRDEVEVDTCSCLTRAFSPAAPMTLYLAYLL